jgi:hypothetical protein
LVDDVDVVGPLGHVDTADVYRGDLAAIPGRDPHHPIQQPAGGVIADDAVRDQAAAHARDDLRVCARALPG